MQRDKTGDTKRKKRRHNELDVLSCIITANKIVEASYYIFRLAYGQDPRFMTQKCRSFYVWRKKKKNHGNFVWQ